VAIESAVGAPSMQTINAYKTRKLWTIFKRFVRVMRWRSFWSKNSGMFENLASSICF